MRLWAAQKERREKQEGDERVGGRTKGGRNGRNRRGDGCVDKSAGGGEQGGRAAGRRRHAEAPSATTAVASRAGSPRGFFRGVKRTNCYSITIMALAWAMLESQTHKCSKAFRMQSPLVISTLSLSSHQFLPLLFSHLKLFVIDVRMWPACFPQCVVKSRRSSSQSMGSDSQLAKDGVRYSQYPVRCVPVVSAPCHTYIVVPPKSGESRPVKEALLCV